MKSKNLILSAMLMALPSTLMAQQNIQKAFDALLKDKIVETKTQHTLERDPETGRKTAQADVYDFTLPTLYARKHIKEIQEAFEKDKNAAYTYRTGTHRQDEVNERVDKKRHETMLSVIHYSRIQIAVGDGKHNSVAIGGKDGANYVYACFTDKDDATKKYRYCYAMDWVEQNGETIVRLAVTYALKPEARSYGKGRITSVTLNGKPLKIDEIMEAVGDQLENIKGFGDNFEFDLDSIDAPKSSYIWLSEFNTYKKFFLKNPDGNTATHHATSIYNLCKNADGLEADEKKLAAMEIAKLKKATKDDFIQNLFDMCIERLGK